MFQTVDQVVGSIMLELRLSQDQRIYVRNYVINFLYQFRLHVECPVNVYAVARVPMSLTIPFPDDYIKWSAVGWVVSGQLKLAAQNKNLASNLALNQAGIFQGVQQQVYLGPNGQQLGPTPANLNAAYGQRLAGSGMVSGAIIPELNGYFKEDIDNRVILLSPNLVWPNFYMSYLSSCFDASDKYRIHPFSYLCCKQYARFHYLKDAYGTSASKIELEGIALDNAMVELKRLYNDMSVFDYLTSYDQNVTSL